MKKLAKIFLTALILTLAVSVLGACDFLKSEYTVTFVDHYGEVIKVETVKSGSSANAPTVEQKIGDIYFQHWSVEFNDVKGDIITKAVYDYNYYNVTFNTNGGTSVDTQHIKYGELPTYYTSEKAGYTLLGWYTDKALTNAYTFESPLDADTTLYAYFYDDYTDISTAESLNAIINNPEGKYILKNDINLNNTTWTSIENFSGILEGDGHKIYNFSMSGNSTLFGFVNTNEGTIKNISFEEFTFIYNRDCSDGINPSAGIVSAINNGIIKNCIIQNTIGVQITAHVANTSTSTFINASLGGLAGQNSGTISECKISSDISYNTSCMQNAYTCSCDIIPYLGAIIGKNMGTLEKSSYEGNINSLGSLNHSKNTYATGNYTSIGGLVGINTGTTAKISECAVKSNINVTQSGTGTNSAKDIYIGHLIGKNNDFASIINCLSEGSLTVNNSNQTLEGTIGGIVGTNNSNSTISNIFSNVNVTIGANISVSKGDLAGTNAENAILSNCVSIGNMDDADQLSKLQSAEYLFNNLHWRDDIWQVNEGSTPTLKCFSE